MPSQHAPPHSIAPLQEAHVEACCALEARAFNVLRREWGQAEQAPRRKDWLAHHIRHYPKNGKVALRDDTVIGYGLVHTWGSLGWVGPVWGGLVLRL